MKILILSPLFPPDTGAPAAYVKELAARFATAHDVRLLIFGYLPEEVLGVRIISVDKRKTLPVRLLSFTKSFFALASWPDLIILNNAPSLELPFLLASFFVKTPYILIESDAIAVEANKRGLYKFIHDLIKKQAKQIISISDVEIYKKAEKLPFTEFDAAREAHRETWWQSHFNVITR